MATPLEVASILVGAVPRSFPDCVRRDQTTAIDLDEARRQHDAYVTAVSALAPVQALEADERFPDSVFVEDTVVVLDAGHAVVTRPGTASREGEVVAVADALGASMELFRLQAPATLDGGDVLRVGMRLFVGCSSRTNRAGADALAALAAPRGIETVVVAVPSGLHLKSACSLADEDTLLFDSSVGLDLEPFRRAGLTCLAAPEAAGANVLALGGGRVLVSEAARATAILLRNRGLEATTLSMSQFHAADGALTCCSVRLPAPGAWCT